MAIDISDGGIYFHNILIAKIIGGWPTLLDRFKDDVDFNASAYRDLQAETKQTIEDLREQVADLIEEVNQLKAENAQLLAELQET